MSERMVAKGRRHEAHQQRGTGTHQELREDVLPAQRPCRTDVTTKAPAGSRSSLRSDIIRRDVGTEDGQQHHHAKADHTDTDLP